MNDPTGMIEILELSSLDDIESIKCAMLEAADVEIGEKVQTNHGCLMIVVRGDLDSVHAAVNAGEAAASQLDVLIAIHVIPRPGVYIVGSSSKEQDS